jgi:hemerythrin-like domain-containing protein
MSASDIAISTIKLEHRSLGMVLHVLQDLLRKVAAGHVVADFGVFATALYYIDDFPERCHHPKEDEYLFKRLRLRTSEFDAVLDQLQTEHARSAITVAGLHRALVHYQGGAAEGLRLFKAAVDSYAADMRSHFRQEDDLMACAGAVLTDEDWELIAWAFTTNDDPLFGDNLRLEFSQLYHRIMRLVPRKMKTALHAARVLPPRPL